MASWFVRPETTTLHVDDQTLVVRKFLTIGEHRARMARLYDTTAAGLRVNPRQVGLATVSAFLLDWSLTDDDGAPIPIRGLSMDDLQRVLDDLFPDRFAAIQDAIEAHEAAMSQARADLKNDADWRAHIAADLTIARRCGWRYDWVQALDPDVYDVLVELLLTEQDH